MTQPAWWCGALLACGQEGAVPWDLLVRVSSLLLDRGPSTVEALKAAIVPAGRGLDVAMVPVLVRRSTTMTAALGGSAPALVLLAGDAALSANYRLGIGVNRYPVTVPTPCRH